MRKLSLVFKRFMMDSVQKKFSLPSRYTDSEYNPWVEFGELAHKFNPINLGQGFTDDFPPDYVAKHLIEAANSKNPLMHQYTRSSGHLRLVNAIGKLYSKLINRDINPKTEVLITCGAYEALFCCINGHLNYGDEVIIIEPFFDCYEPMVRVAGGIPRFIALKNTREGQSGDFTTSSWKLDEKELRSLFNEKTKMIILNTPNNPLGKVFSLDELKLISELSIQYNVLCIADEVYEWMVYKPLKHIRIASLPGMWERTITIGSAGKTFSITGWKCGWAYGPDYLIKHAGIVHQNNTYTYNTPIQEAIALCFEKEIERFHTPECYFHSISEEVRPKRDSFVKILNQIGLVPTIPEAGYFMLVDWSNLAKYLDLSSEPDTNKDFKFAKWTTKNIKVQGIPPSVFYSKKNQHLAANYIRYCFFKKDETLDAAASNFLKWKITNKL